MANRRMFSKDVVSTDRFLELSLSAQALYLHLGVNADDDGFVSNPKTIVRMTGANQKDAEQLVREGFIKPFESGVVVIIHWKQNNYIQKDRYTPTIYQKELAMLGINGNVYMMDTECIQGVSTGKDRLGKDRLGKIREGKSNTANAKPSASDKSTHNSEGAEIIHAMIQVDPKNKKNYNRAPQRRACDFLIEEYGLEGALKAISFYVKAREKGVPYLPVITSPIELVDKWQKLVMLIERMKNKEGEARSNYV